MSFGDDVELLLLLALDVLITDRAEHIVEPRARRTCGAIIFAEIAERRQDPGELTARLGIAPSAAAGCRPAGVTISLGAGGARAYR